MRYEQSADNGKVDGIKAMAAGEDVVVPQVVCRECGELICWLSSLKPISSM